MIVESIAETKAKLVFTLDELITLANCINEAMELGEEFDTRVGSEIETASNLMRQLHEVIDSLGNRQS